MSKKKNLCELSQKYLEKGEVVSPLNDRVFKALLQDESCLEYLKDLIEGITEIPKSAMTDLKFENVEHQVKHVLEKGKISDIIVSIEKNIIVLEMNKNYYDGIFDRNLGYVTGIQSSKLKKGSSYKDIKKSILINFDNEWQYEDELILKFMMRSEKGKYIETENIESYHINLAQFHKIYYNKTRKLSRFEKELVILTLNKLKMLEKISKGDKVMEEAKEKLENLTEDSVFIGLYDEELEKEREYKDRMAYAEKIGMEKGLEQGIQSNKIETAKKMKDKGLDASLIKEITGLSLEEIEKL